MRATSSSHTEALLLRDPQSEHVLVRPQRGRRAHPEDVLVSDSSENTLHFEFLRLSEWSVNQICRGIEMFIRNSKSVHLIRMHIHGVYLSMLFE